MVTYKLEQLRSLLSKYKISKEIMTYSEDMALFENVNQFPVDPNVPVRLDMAVFGLCTKGFGELMINSRKFEVRENSYLVVFPNQVVQLADSGRFGRGIFICISNKLYNEMMQRMQVMLPLYFHIKEHPCEFLSENDTEWIREYHAKIFAELGDENNMFRRQTARALLAAMFYKLCNLYGSNLYNGPITRNRQEDIFAKFMNNLTQNFREHREVSWYAEQMCITPKYLTTTVKLVSGKGANEWIWTYVIEEAKLQLRTTHKPIQQISAELHFASQSFFGKYFKQYTDMSPQAYRKSLHEREER